VIHKGILLLLERKSLLDRIFLLMMNPTATTKAKYRSITR